MATQLLVKYYINAVEDSWAHYKNYDAFKQTVQTLENGCKSLLQDPSNKEWLRQQLVVYEPNYSKAHMKCACYFQVILHKMNTGTLLTSAITVGVALGAYFAHTKNAAKTEWA